VMSVHEAINLGVTLIVGMLLGFFVAKGMTSPWLK
jgi:uncharacterized protein YneF (UPF0154 family)